MTAPDRQKLAETVRTAFAAHYRTGNYADLGMAMQDVQNDLLAALAQPCQECEALRAELRSVTSERDNLYDQEWPWEWVIATREKQRREAAEAEVAALRAKLAEAEHRAEGWVQHDTEAYAAQSMRALRRAEAAEDRAQRYREALWDIASGAWMEDAPRHKYSVRVFARRALSADPFVCRDPDLCWGTGTCPRDPACNE